MSIDFNLLNSCDHKYMQIIEIEGSSPSYFADLDFTCNPNLSTITILDGNTCSEEALFGMNNSTFEGITNFYIDPSTNKRILFGAYPVDSGMVFPNPDSRHVPSDKYFCSYIVKTEECPKCIGSKIVQDISIDATGRISTISGSEKIKQQIRKIIMTLSGNSLYDSAYGSTLQSLIGQKLNAYTAANLQFSVLDSINHLIDLQNASNLPPEETIKSISNIEAVQDANDPRKININIIVISQNYEEISTSISLKI